MSLHFKPKQGVSTIEEYKEYCEQRRMKLHAFFQQVVTLPRAKTHPALLNFLGIEDYATLVNTGGFSFPGSENVEEQDLVLEVVEDL